jgi:predicted anti-sigma-YlaC factor YlaD
VTIHNELTCKEFVEIVTEYLEGSMSPEERDRFENHFRSCQGCQTYLEQMRQTIKMVGKLSEDHLSPEAQNTLLKVFWNWKKHR